MKTVKTYPIVHNDKDKLFTFVERAENDVIICVGNNVVSSLSFKKWQDAKDYTKRKPWELICNVTSIITQQTIKTIKANEKAN